MTFNNHCNQLKKLNDSIVKKSRHWTNTKMEARVRNLVKPKVDRADFMFSGASRGRNSSSK